MVRRLVIHLDTHIVVWLFSGRLDLLSDEAARQIARQPCRVSPMVRLELQYLHEIGRLQAQADEVVTDLKARIGLAYDQSRFGSVVSSALALAWTRDPFDRLIVAQADHASAPLVSRDQLIRQHYPRTIWL